MWHTNRDTITGVWDTQTPVIFEGNMKTLIEALNKIINAVGYFCGVLLLLMIFTVFYNVIMRYWFNDVSIALQEMEWHLFAAMFMFGIGYTLKEDGHVRVDILYEKFSPQTKAWINLFGSLIFALPFSGLIIYFGYSHAFDAYQMGEGSADPGGLPYRWIIRSVIPISTAFVMLSLVQIILLQIQTLTSKNSNDEEQSS